MSYLTNIGGTQLTSLGGSILSNLSGDDLITDGGTTNYFYNFTDNDGLLWRIEFYDRTYLANTSWTELKGNGANLRWLGPTSDTYQAIIPGELTVPLALNTESRALLNKILNGYEAQFAVILLEVLTDPIDHDDPTTYSRKWNGIVMQDAMTIADAVDYDNYITLVCTDGFGLLRDVKYIGGIMGPTPDPYTLNDWRSYRWRQLFSGCLNQLPFYAVITDSLDWDDELTRFYSCASVWYEDSQESSPTDDPLDNIYLSESAFVSVDNYGVDEGMNLYDMLTHLLEMFNLTVKQWGGTFLVIQDNTNTQSQTRAWHYGWQNNSLIETELIDLQTTYDFTKRSNGQYTHLLPAKRVTTNYDYRTGVYSNNLLPQIVTESVVYPLGVSEAGTQLRLKGRLNITYVGDPSVTDDLCIVFKLRVKVGDFYLSTDEYNTASWIDDSGEYARIVSVPFNGATSTHVVADFNWLTPAFVDDTTVIASKDMVVGTRYKILTLGDTDWVACGYIGTPAIGGTFYCAAPASSVEVGTVNLWYAAGGYDMETDWELLQWEIWAIPPTGTPYTPVGTQLIGYAAEAGTWIFQVYSTAPMQSTQKHSASVVNLAKAEYMLPDSIFGDGIFSFLAGQIQVWDGANYVNSDLWTIYSEIGETGLPLNSLRVKEMMAMRRSTVQFFEAEFAGVPDIHKGFTWETYNWAWRSIDWNIAAGIFTGTAMRVSVNRLGITIDTPLIATDENSSSGNSQPTQITNTIVSQSYWNRDSGTARLSTKTVGDDLYLEGLLGIGRIAISTLDVYGSVGFKVRKGSSTATLDGNDFIFIATANTFTVNLPDATACENRAYIIRNKGAGTITLDPYSTQTIDDNSTRTIASGNGAMVISDGSNWISILG